MAETPAPVTPPTQPPRVVITFGGGQTSIINYGLATFLREHPRCRVLVAAAAVACGLLWVAGYLVPGYLSGTLFVGLIAAPWLMYVVVIAGHDFELTFPVQKATVDRQQAESLFERSNAPEDAVKLDLSRLNEYYVINQSQARSSFRWAIVAMIAGFGTIISGIWLFYFRSATPDVFMASLSTGAGIVVNLVSVLFLYLHSKTQDRSIYYFDQLSRLQSLSIAIRLADAHTDPGDRKKARDLVIRELVKGRNGPGGSAVAR
jgi:hypothetical protein